MLTVYLLLCVYLTVVLIARSINAVSQVGKLKELRAYLHDPHAPIIRKLAMLSLLEVFKDIIPEYRIRVITQTEKHQKVPTY